MEYVPSAMGKFDRNNPKPIDKVNKVIDAATQAGANQVQGASFTFSDDSSAPGALTVTM